MSHISKTKSVNSKAGFTLLEILLVVGIIAILAGIVILAINPTKQLGDARNAQRRSDVLTILNAIYQYTIDPGHTMADFTLSANDDVCDATDTDAFSLEGLLAPTYIATTPLDPDPSVGVAGVSSGYYINQNSNGRITVCAPSAANDNGATINVTR